MEFIELCRRFIAIDSSSSHGSREIALLAADYCRQRGLEVELQEEAQDEANVIARPPGVGRPQAEFMFQTHLDTADPGPFQMWARNGQNPYDAAIYEGRMHGLGAADSKLDFLCKLEALTPFAGRTQWTLPPVLVGTYGEERGMLGALRLIRKNKISAKMALIGEPTDLRLVNAAKGFAVVEIQLSFSSEEMKYRQEHDLKESTSTQSRLFRGQAAHSSDPQQGESAIAKMLDYLDQLPDGVVIMEIDGGQSKNTVPAHAFLEIETAIVKDAMAQRIRGVRRAIQKLESDFQNYHDSDFQPSHPTLNLGVIRTQESGVLMVGSCRIPPNIPHGIYEKWMEDLRLACEGFKAQFQVLDYKKPFRTPESSILLKGCRDELRRMGLVDFPGTQAATNEASLFHRLGVECLCFGAGVRESNSHTPHENVRIEDLHRATQFYRQVIERFCL